MHMWENLGGVPAFWFWPGPGVAVLTVWGMGQRKEEFLFLALILSLCKKPSLRSQPETQQVNILHS